MAPKSRMEQEWGRVLLLVPYFNLILALFLEQKENLWDRKNERTTALLLQSITLSKKGYGLTSRNDGLASCWAITHYQSCWRKDKRKAIWQLLPVINLKNIYHRSPFSDNAVRLTEKDLCYQYMTKFFYFPLRSWTKYTQEHEWVLISVSSAYFKNISCGEILWEVGNLLLSGKMKPHYISCNNVLRHLMLMKPCKILCSCSMSILKVKATLFWDFFQR